MNLTYVNSATASIGHLHLPHTSFAITELLLHLCTFLYINVSLLATV